MAAITIVSRPVYHAPTKGRSYLTVRAAARNEADALISKKYPTERPEYENGMCYFPGWNWRCDEQMQKLHARLARMILFKFRKTQLNQAKKESK